MPAPRGRTLGGSSAINVGIAVRARATDFTAWQAHGLDGWSFEDVLPTFKALETRPTATMHTMALGSATAAPAIVRRAHAPIRAFIAAAVVQGFKAGAVRRARRHGHGDQRRCRAPGT
jgi:choline dehydrogenase